MELRGLHILLTYQCSLECDHCFVFGSPWQRGTMSLRHIRELLQQAKDVGTVDWIYFEGGEPFLHYPILVRGVEDAVGQGFKVGIVTNCYWATELADASEWLRSLSGSVQNLGVSCDSYHCDEASSRWVKNACEAAAELNIPIGVISIARAGSAEAPAASGQLPAGESAVMHRGRAADKLAAKAPQHPWEGFGECPFEDLREPGRLHVDPFGNVHICQGISLGNMFRTPLGEICRRHDADSHPITGPLLEGGPAELVRRHGLPHGESYADACHLCFRARLSLRERFPDILMPDQMYGVVEAQGHADAGDRRR